MNDDLRDGTYEDMKGETWREMKSLNAANLPADREG